MIRLRSTGFRLVYELRDSRLLVLMVAVGNGGCASKRSAAMAMRFALPQGFSHGDDCFHYLRDAFDVLYREGEERPAMMSVAMHCRLLGRPARRLLPEAVAEILLRLGA
jgi:peptidoglycan/xylan/chitin deacetylase (PgdA/CDA1 family)